MSSFKYMPFDVKFYSTNVCLGGELSKGEFICNRGFSSWANFEQFVAQKFGGKMSIYATNVYDSLGNTQKCLSITVKGFTSFVAIVRGL